jgi:hypothetical protein
MHLRSLQQRNNHAQTARPFGTFGGWTHIGQRATNYEQLPPSSSGDLPYAAADDLEAAVEAGLKEAEARSAVCNTQVGEAILRTLSYWSSPVTTIGRQGADTGNRECTDGIFGNRPAALDNSSNQMRRVYTHHKQKTQLSSARAGPLALKG